MASISQVIIISSRGPAAFRLVEGRLSAVRKGPPKYFTDGFQGSLGLPGLREGVPGQMNTLGFTPCPPTLKACRTPPGQPVLGETENAKQSASPRRPTNRGSRPALSEQDSAALHPLPCPPPRPGLEFTPHHHPRPPPRARQVMTSASPRTGSAAQAQSHATRSGRLI